MYLKNEKGETLIEVIVSMLILAIVVMSASTIIMFSIKASGNSLQIIKNTNEDVTAIETLTLDSAELQEFSTEIDISFSITNALNDNDIIVYPKEYNIASNLESKISKNGFVFFNLEQDS